MSTLLHGVIGISTFPPPRTFWDFHFTARHYGIPILPTAGRINVTFQRFDRGRKPNFRYRCDKNIISRESCYNFDYNFESNSTADESISKGAGFGIFQEFRGRMNALQTFSTPIIIHKNSKIMIYIGIIVLKDSFDLVKHFRSLLK
jgi:hypothetical protein